MSMRFRYRHFALKNPVLPLGGRFVRPRPVVGVSVIGPAKTRIRQALLDTASDDTVFPESMATEVGIDLTNAPTGQAVGLTLAGVLLRYAEVTLQLTDGHESRQWQGWVGFTKARLFLPVLGFAGCLQFFSANFKGDREEVELTVNSLYQGT